MKTSKTIGFIEDYVKAHANAGPRDIYKLVYQSFMGPEHLLLDLFHSKEALSEEFELAAPICGPVFEELVPGTDILRVNIRAFKAKKGDCETLWKTLKLTLSLFRPKPFEFTETWRVLSPILAQNAGWAKDIKLLDDLAYQSNPQPAHHSEKFRREENPSYRIVSKKAIEGIGGLLWELHEKEIKKQPSASREIMPDVAGYRPEYEIDIERVGIEYLDYPIVVLDKENKKQSTVAKVRMSVDLPSCWRGTHMSRFIEIINEYRGEITFIQIKQILEEVIRQFQARAAHLTLEFPYFLEKIAPISGLKSLMEYKATFNGEIVEGKFDFKLGVKVPVTTLCPCSKEISENGAHSQRTHIGIEVIGETFVWLEELIELGEKCASSPVYATLKREDEKFVTESAYANPRFVEDVVRAVTKELSSRTDILWFRVRASSNESIHNHSAFAQITRGKQGARLKCHSE